MYVAQTTNKDNKEKHTQKKTHAPGLEEGAEEQCLGHGVEGATSVPTISRRTAAGGEEDHSITAHLDILQELQYVQMKSVYSIYMYMHM